MKEAIKYNAESELLETIEKWQQWLRYERRYSEHTLNAYSRDLAFFINFFAEKPLTLDFLEKLEIADFRSFVSHRAGKHLEKSSLAREISSVKNFFKWLDNNAILKNAAISILSSPRLPKLLPKAVDSNDIFSLFDKSLNSAKQEWQGLRDRAVLILLYGCGLRISEALSLNVGDFNRESTFLCIKGKGNKERIVPLLPVIFEAVEARELFNGSCKKCGRY